MDFLELYDSLFYYMKEENSIFSNIIIINLELDGIVETSFYKEKIEKLLLKYPKLSKIIEKSHGNLYWKNVNININNHVKEIKRKKYTLRSINNIINKIINKPFNNKNPKWKFYNIIYQDRSFFIIKMHHAYGDGDKCVEMFQLIFDLEEVKVKNKKKSKEGYFSKIWKATYYFFVSLYMILYFLLFFKKEKIFKSTVKNEAVYSNIYNFNINELKLKKIKLGVTMNDLLYSIILKSIRKYIDKDVYISSSSMINLRKAGNNLKESNNFGFVMFSTYVNNSNLFEKINKQMNFYKKSPIIPCIINILKCIFQFSSPLVVKFLTYIFNKNHFGYSNYNSKIKSLRIDNKNVKHMGNIIIPYKQDVFFSLLSYNDEIRLNMCYKDGILDEKKFINCVKEVVSEL
jgi:hypothetical protein